MSVSDTNAAGARPKVTLEIRHQVAIRADGRFVVIEMFGDEARQRAGEDVGDARVKRQTIRAFGPRASRLLPDARSGYRQPGTLHLWWKSRTPERALLGVIESHTWRAWPLSIIHERETGDTRLAGPRGWRRGRTAVTWLPGSPPNDPAIDLASEAFADGFDSPSAFRDYFVPRPGDVFTGILFRW